MRLKKDAKIALISAVPLFSRCSRRELAAIAAAADEVELPAGRVLTREGEHGREFFVLVEGRAEVRKRGRRIRTLAAGDFFGEIALVGRIPRTATVTVSEPSRLLVITDTGFGYLLAHTPKLQREVLQALAERLAPETI